METIKTRTIMTKADNGDKWFGIDYHMNLYKGCNLGCIYCNVRSDTYHIDNFDQVSTKEDALDILEKELSSKTKKGVVSFGSLSDPYNGAEEKMQLTRKALKLVHKYGFGVSIDTKSDLVLRDLDILKEIAADNNVIIKVSITTTDLELQKILEPNVISTNKRFEVVKTLRENNIYCGVLIHPVLPFLTDNEENILSLIQKAGKAKANFIYTKMGMTLQTNQREYFYEKIEKHYIGISSDYDSVFGKRYHCNTLQYRRLMELFLKEASKYQMFTDMEDIIKGYKKDLPTNEQISLF